VTQFGHNQQEITPPSGEVVPSLIFAPEARFIYATSDNLTQTSNTLLAAESAQIAVQAPGIQQGSASELVSAVPSTSKKCLIEIYQATGFF
jgi:hypothetical protein